MANDNPPGNLEQIFIESKGQLKASFDQNSSSTSGFDLAAFADEYDRYIGAYQELLVIDSLAKLAQNFTQILTHEPNPALNGLNLTGLAESYNGLLAFERKYPFLNRSLSQQALNFTEIKPYLIERK